MKLNKVILYFLLAVYALVIVHTGLPHDHHNHSANDLLEGKDVCCLVQYVHGEDESDNHIHHHPHSHHEHCQHISQYLKNVDIKDLLNLQPYFFTLFSEFCVPDVQLVDLLPFSVSPIVTRIDPYGSCVGLRAPPTTI